MPILEFTHLKRHGHIRFLEFANFTYCTAQRFVIIVRYRKFLEGKKENKY